MQTPSAASSRTQRVRLSLTGLVIGGALLVEGATTRQSGRRVFVTESPVWSWRFHRAARRQPIIARGLDSN